MLIQKETLSFTPTTKESKSQNKFEFLHCTFTRSFTSGISETDQLV